MFERIFHIDYRSLAAFRIGLAILLLCDLLNRSFDLIAHYTDSGVLPRDVYIQKFQPAWHWSVHLMGGNEAAILFLFGLHALLAIALLVGLKTRLTHFFCWFLLISLHSRNPIILQGGDVLLRVLFFWGLFLPLGARWSVDSAMAPTKSSGFSANLATMALLLQVSMVYLFTVLLKNDPAWWQGQAVYLALAIDQFTTPLGNWLLQQKSLLPLLTYSTITWEFIGAVIVFSPWRTARLRMIAILGFGLMHLGLGMCMELGLFPWISLCSWLVFLPGLFWDQLADWLRRGEWQKIEIFYDGDCGFCQKSVLILAEFLGFERHQIKPAQIDATAFETMQFVNSWVVRDENGSIYTEFAAGLVLSKSWWILDPLTYILRFPPIFLMGNWAYRLVANRRVTFSALTRGLAPKPVMLEIHWFWQGVSLFFLLYVTAWNIRTIDFNYYVKYFPKHYNWVGQVVRVDQYWNMFAPFPLRDDGWYVIDGKLINGQEFDVFNSKSEVNFDKPPLVSRTYPNQRWRKYMMNIWFKKYSKHRLYYGRYLCRSFSTKYADKPALASFKLFFVKEYTGDNYRFGPPEKILLWDHKCFP
tara:strand:+ start:1621 stop:3375 length:1755 start_codon:yes stop_codon:yes gene_type:complete